MVDPWGIEPLELHVDDDRATCRAHYKNLTDTGLKNYLPKINNSFLILGNFFITASRFSARGLDLKVSE